MKRLLTILTSAICALALSTIGTSKAHAGVDIQFFSGFPHTVHRGHQRHPAHNVHRGHRNHNNNNITLRGSTRHNYRPRQFGHNLHNSACHPVSVRAHDHHGREFFHPATLCYDRFGRPFVLDD